MRNLTQGQKDLLSAYDFKIMKIMRIMLMMMMMILKMNDGNDDDHDDDHDQDDDDDHDDHDDLLLGLSFSGQLHQAHHLRNRDITK